MATSPSPPPSQAARTSGMAVVMRIVGNAVGPIGVGIALTGWVNPLIGVGAMALGAIYVIWELATLDVVVRNVPGMLRFLGCVLIGAIVVAVSWNPLKEVIHKKAATLYIPTPNEIAKEVWKEKPLEQGSTHSVPSQAPIGEGSSSKTATPPTAKEIAGEVARLWKPEPDKPDTFKDDALGVIVEVEDFNKDLMQEYMMAHRTVSPSTGEAMVREVHQQLYVEWNKVGPRVQAIRDELARRNIRDDELDASLRFLNMGQNAQFSRTMPENDVTPAMVDRVTQQLRGMLDKLPPKPPS